MAVGMVLGIGSGSSAIVTLCGSPLTHVLAAAIVDKGNPADNVRLNLRRLIQPWATHTSYSGVPNDVRQ